MTQATRIQAERIYTLALFSETIRGTVDEAIEIIQAAKKSGNTKAENAEVKMRGLQDKATEILLDQLQGLYTEEEASAFLLFCETPIGESCIQKGALFNAQVNSAVTWLMAEALN